MSKHTPGPWSFFGWQINQSGPMTFFVGPNVGAVCKISNTAEWQKQHGEANARLIAAAPDLLEALISTMAHLAAAISLLERGGKAAKKAAPSDKMFDQMLKDYKAALSRARAAIAKAEGGQ